MGHGYKSIMRACNPERFMKSSYRSPMGNYDDVELSKNPAWLKRYRDKLIKQKKWEELQRIFRLSEEEIESLKGGVDE